jgi:glycosyltransferase involved in cell wall biosynthesis
VLTKDFLSDGCLVADPGMRPELRHAAVGLARRGNLSAYVTDVVFSADGRAHRIARALPGRLREPVARRMRLRQVSSEVSRRQIRHAASAIGAAEFAARTAGLGPGPISGLRKARNERLDSQVAKRLTGNVNAALLSSSACVRSLTRCALIGVPSILNYPIAHHKYARELLLEEAALVPAFASTLQYPAESSSVARRLDEECALADHILTYSPFHRQSFIDVGFDPSRLLQVPLGVDTDLFSPRERRRTGGESSRFRVLFVGQITQRKGLSYLIDGFRKAAIDDSELVLVGTIAGTDAPWRNVPNVRYVPSVPRSVLPELYAEADVFVMPSLVEGFCLTALEALACGVPAIVTPNTFGDEIVRDEVEGWTVPIRDSDAIAEGLARLSASDTLRREMAEHARLRAEELSWTHYEDTISETVGRVASRCPR